MGCWNTIRGSADTGEKIGLEVRVLERSTQTVVRRQEQGKAASQVRRLAKFLGAGGMPSCLKRIFQARGGSLKKTPPPLLMPRACTLTGGVP